MALVVARKPTKIPETVSIADSKVSPLGNESSVAIHIMAAAAANKNGYQRSQKSLIGLKASPMHFVRVEVLPTDPLLRI